MRMLDRYVLTTFLKVFFGTLITFVALAMVLDFFGRFGELLDKKRVQGTFAEEYSMLELIFHFYVAYLPFMIKEVMPFITVSSGLFTVTLMLKGNEVAPVVGAGVSVRRPFLPVFACGLVISAAHFAFEEYAVPALNKKQIALKRFFSGDRKQGVYRLVHLRDGHGTVTRAEWFSFNDRSLHTVAIQRPWKDNSFELWSAEVLMPDGDRWTAPKGVTIAPPGVEAVPRRLPDNASVDFGVTPAEVEALASRKGTMEVSYTQLLSLARKFPNRRHLRVALYKQFARPFTSFVMLLVGVPILLSWGRSYFLGGAIAFGLSAGFYFFDIFFTSLGDRGDLPAVFAAYYPLAFLFSIAVARLAVVPT